MKKIIKNLWVLGIILLVSCSNSDDSGDPGVSPDANFTFNFTHYWDDTNVTNLDFNTIQFTNANGEELSIEKLRYLNSKITFQNTDGTTTVIDGYNLEDVTNNTNIRSSYSTSTPSP